MQKYLCSLAILGDCSEVLFQRISIRESDSREDLLGTLKAEIVSLSRRYDVYQMHIACQLLSEGDIILAEFSPFEVLPSFTEEWIPREEN